MSDKFRSVLQRVLVWLVIVGLVLPPAPFFVGEARASGSEADATKLTQAENLALVGATEVPSKRTAKSRVFETSDGRGRAEVHSESIHYQDSQGAWQPINNNLTTSSGGYAYQNTANRYTAKFKSTLTSDYLYFQQGSDSITVSLLDSTAGSAQTSGNTITYSGIRTGVDMRYTVGSDSLKSDFVLKQEPSNRTFTYAITVSSGLSLSTANGGIKVVKNSATIWELPRPSAIQPITGEPVFTNYALESTGSSSYEATFTIPDNFLPVPERGYPVTIDPSIVVVTGDANTASNYVLEGEPSNNYRNDPDNKVMPVGRTTYGEARGYMKFDLSSTVPANQVIDGATFSITMQEERASIPRIKLHRVTQQWDPVQLNWDNQPTVQSSFEDSYAHGVTYAWWNFNVTSLAQGWYAGSVPNYGLSLRAHDPNVSRRNFLSKYYSNRNDRQYDPYILIYYHPSGEAAPTPPQMLGSKPWWRYASTPLAIGTGSVNIANGNLVFNFNDVSAQDQGLDVSIDHTYNSKDTYDDKFGYGWTISANKRLIPSSDRKTVVFTDESGTSFTFRDSNSNGNYVDDQFDASSGFYRKENHRPNGLNWGLKYDSGTQKYTAKANNASTYTFDSAGKILEEKDRNGNKITYSYTSGNLVSVEGNSGKKINLYYAGTGGRLSKVEDYNTGDSSFSSNGSVVLYEYDNGDLKTLTFKKNGDSIALSTTTFNYTSHRLTSIVDGRSKTTSFTYDGSNRVTDIYDAESKRTNITYTDPGLTKVTSAKYYVEGGDQEKYQTDYSYRTNPFFQTGLVYREVGPKLTNNQSQTVRNTTEYDYNDDYQLHASTDPAGNVSASAYDDISGLLFYQFNENRTLTLKNSYAGSNYDSGNWRLVDSYSGNGTQTTFRYDANGNLTRKGVLDGNINLVHNPGYESSVRDPDPDTFDLSCEGNYVKQGVADYWCGSGTGSNGRVYGIDATTSADGSQSQYVGFNNNTTKGSVNAFQTIDEATRPLPDTNYYLTWKYKNESANNFYVQIGIIHYDTRNNIIGSPIFDSNHYSSTTWDEKSLTFHTPASNSQTGLPYWTSDIFMRAYAATTGSTTAKAWFDSVRLTQGTVASLATEKVTTFEYTDTTHAYPTGLPLKEITPEGKETKYDWDARGNLTKVTDSLNKTTTYTYDTNGNKLTKVEPNGNETSGDSTDFKFVYTYDSRGRITSVTEAKTSRQTSYTYDANGNLTQTITPNGLKTTYTYDNVNRSKNTTNPYGFESAVEYDAQGNPKGITDPNGRNSSAAYDGNDRLTTETNPSGQNTAYAYDNTSNLKKIDENSKTLQYNYDASGQLTQETNDQLASNQSVQYQYDNAGNLTTINPQTGEAVAHTYSATDEVTTVKVEGRTTTYTRNKNNQLIKLDKPNGDSVEYTYDDNARITVINNIRSSTTFLKYEYQYDANGNRTQIKTTQNGSTVTVDYEYDNLNQLKKIITSAKTTTYTYNSGGNITRIEDTTGAWTNYDYSGNRLIKKSTSTGSNEYFGYDSGGNLTSRDTSDRASILAHLNSNPINARDNQAGKVENPSSSYTPVYETGKFGQALQLNTQTYLSFPSSSNISPITGTVEMWVKPHWNNDSSSRTFFDYTVDANNYLRLGKSADNRIVFDLVRGGNGNYWNATSPLTWTNGTWTHLAVSWDGTAAHVYRNGQEVSLNGAQSEEEAEFTGSATKVSFGATGGTTPSDYADASLDEIRLSAVVRTSTEIAASYNATSELTLPNTTIYEYDSQDYLTKITQPNATVFEYKYDANKRLIKRIKTGTSDINYQYDGDKIVSERNNDNSIILRYAYDTLGQLLKITKPSGAEYFPTTDGLGSIVQVRDGNGDIMNSYQYDEWGKITSKTENFALSTRYASYWQDDGTGLYHLGSRWYDPNLNRFLLVDPHPGDQDDPVTLNEYTYTGSNPVIRTDADGNYFETALDLASVVYSISEFRKNKSIGNAGLVAFDGMMLALPVLPGSGTIRWIAKAGKSSNKVGNVRKITGYTAHGLEQALSREGRGVAPSAILDAVKNPSKTIKQAGKTTKYVGKRAVVVLNKTGKVVTTWAKNAKGWRIK